MLKIGTISTSNGVIATTPPVRIVRGDDVQVVTGHYRGQQGTAVCVHRHAVTISRANGRTFLVKISECEKQKETAKSGLNTTE